MNRRESLTRSAICGAAFWMGNAASSAFGAGEEPGADPMAGMRIIDPHQHPDKNPLASRDHAAGYRFLKSIGAAAACYSAIGDRQNGRYDEGLSPHESAQGPLRWWLDGIVAEEKVKLVLKAADIPGPHPPDPGPFSASRGGDALGGNAYRVLAQTM